MRLFDLLRADAAKFPDKPAAVFPRGQRVTFAELDRESDAVAGHLAGRGIGPGDRVAIIADNSRPALTYFWGILKTGAQSVDLPTLAAAKTLQGAIDEAAPKAVVFDPRHLQNFTAGDDALRLPQVVLGTAESSDVAAGRDFELTTLESIVSASAAAPDVAAVDADDVAMIVYTSGTTGRPNGVMLSHANMISNLRAANELMNLGPGDSILVVVPLYYIHGRMQLLMHALLGGTVVFSSGFAFPAKVVKELAEFQVSGFSGVPYHFTTLMDRTKLADAALPDLKYVLITGGALSPAGLQRLSDAMPGAQLHLAYGQTEASPRITYLGPDDLVRKAGSCGKALPGVEVEILGGDGEPVAAGQVGEVVAGGPNIMKGYVGQDAVQMGKLDHKGRLRTGDLGRLDDEGFLFLVGRSSQMIKTAGERIFPQEIEDALDAHPAIAHSAVLGIPDPSLGERIVACVVLHTGQSLELSDLRTHCLRYMPFVRVPRELRVLDALPKTASGKIDRAALAREQRGE